MGYPTRADLVAASDVAALTGASATAQDGWHASAKRNVERFCGQRFDSWDETRSLDGSDQRKLALDVRLALLTALAVRGERATSLVATDVELTPDHDALIVTPTAASGGSWVEKVQRDGRPAVFPLGVGTVQITGTWGWLDSEMPPDDMTTPLAVAMRLDMEDQALSRQHGLAETLRAASRLGIKQTSQGSLSYAQEAPDQLLSVEAQSVLEPLIWQPAGVRV